MSQRPVARLVPTVLVGALAVGLTGCTKESAEPSPLDSPTPASSSASTSGSASASPSPTGAPSMPAEARGTSAASAEAFARYYVDLINYTTLTGDPSAMRRNASRACSTCRDLIDSINDVYRADGRVDGGGWSVEAVRPRVRVAGEEAEVPMRVRILAQTVYSSPGASPSSSRPTHGRLVVFLRQNGSSWKVRQLDAFDQ